MDGHSKDRSSAPLRVVIPYERKTSDTFDCVTDVVNVEAVTTRQLVRDTSTDP